MGLSRVALALLAVVFVARASFALDIPPAPTQWVTDRGGLLSPTDADALNRKLSDFEQRSGAQFIIYIFPTLGDEALEDFTQRCAEAWKVGQKKYDNGLVLFVFVQEKKMRIEVGYGLEPTIPDSIAMRAISEYIRPHFSSGDFAGGLNAGADFLIARIEKKEAPVPPYQSRGSRGGGGDGFNPSLIFILFIILVFVVLPLFSRRRRGCGGCFFPFWFFPGGGMTFGGGGGGGGWGGGGFSGGGGSFGGGGASGGW